MPRSLSLTAAFAGALALVLAPGARAHGTLSPTSAVAGLVQEFELVVPGDRPGADVVGVALELPDAVELVQATAVQPRWSVSSSGNRVVWSGGPIPRSSSEAFAFTARMPAEAGRIELLLVETYDDGAAAPFPIAVTVTGPPAGGGSSGTLGAAALLVAVLALGVATAALVLVLRGKGQSPGT